MHGIAAGAREHEHSAAIRTSHCVRERIVDLHLQHVTDLPHAELLRILIAYEYLQPRL
jgi:hypothetical protein